LFQAGEVVREVVPQDGHGGASERVIIRQKWHRGLSMMHRAAKDDAAAQAGL